MNSKASNFKIFKDINAMKPKIPENEKEKVKFWKSTWILLEDEILRYQNVEKDSKWTTECQEVSYEYKQNHFLYTLQLPVNL